MEDNILRIGTSTIILNGGNPLEGCPKDWIEARGIELQLNNGIDKEDDEYDNLPRWSFDSGFKLDYDGSLIKISSRFYPPKTHYGNSWDGNVTVYFMGEELSKKQFDCPTLKDLKNEVDIYIKSIMDKLRASI